MFYAKKQMKSCPSAIGVFAKTKLCLGHRICKKAATVCDLKKVTGKKVTFIIRT